MNGWLARHLFDAWGIPGAVWLPIGHFGLGYNQPFRPALLDFVERYLEREKYP